MSEKVHLNEEENVPLNSSSNGIATFQNKQTLCERFNGLRENVTIEPVAFLVLLSSVLASVATQTLSLEKACRVSLNLSDEICDAIRAQNSNNVSHYEKMIQEYIAVRLAFRSMIHSIIPCIILPFIGGWSDKTGRRKILMVMPIAGEILQCLSNIINVIFFTIPLEVMIFFDAFFPAVTGSWGVMYLGLFSYISDITTAENRTHRLGLVNFFIFVGVPIGFSLSGIILKFFGYYAVYGVSLTLHTVNLIYLTFKIQDLNITEDKKIHDRRGVRHFFRTFFDLTNVKDTLRVVFKKAPNNRRIRLCILLAVVAVLFGPIYGEVAVLYMSTRYRFNWDEVDFSIFQTYNFITHTVGTIFSILVFSKYLKWHDSILGIISTVSKFAASFVYCFAPNEKVFFAAPLVEILNGTSLLAIRSIFSKLVEPNELGKVNSLIGLTENLMPLVYVPLYTKVYTATMEVLPGAVFLMGAGMTVPAFCVFIWLLTEHRKSVRRANTDDTIETPN
ncbi:proton-coupled folate transporter-like isoform X2 [Manduca sexta]|uniref:proton-coupled folate transporter-like isoform X2 n=1 Tax=Manduca sexta TaxID=7130 RepID=UPI00188EE0EF|nr:proton-coupled folate transporter-like isoform X2 [Manduca sexta]